jgi:hypothetical protein
MADQCLVGHGFGDRQFPDHLDLDRIHLDGYIFKFFNPVTG